MSRTMAIVAGLLYLSSGAWAQPKDEDPWAPLRFLLGTWDAKTAGGGSGATAAGAYTFRLDLREHVLVRHSASAGCKGPADFNCDHSDVLYVYREGGVPKAIYFDNEGHVIHYEVSVPSPRRVVFLSREGPGPRFRLTYELSGAQMRGAFEMRTPGQAEFRTYLAWTGEAK